MNYCRSFHRAARLPGKASTPRDVVTAIGASEISPHLVEFLAAAPRQRLAVFIGGANRPLELREASNEPLGRDFHGDPPTLPLVSLIQENVRRRMSAARAKRQSELEARELRQAPHNLMRHTESRSVAQMFRVHQREC